MSPFPKFADWWVVEAMIASYNHVYKTVYKTQYFDLGPIGVSDYGTAPIASFQLEFLALDDDPSIVVEAVRKYEINGKKYVLNVFHSQPSARAIKEKYAEYGYAFVRTGPIMGFEIIPPFPSEFVEVKRIESKDDLDRANMALYLENESIPAETLNDPHIHNFYAELNGRVVGWTQLITVFPGVGYINQIYTLSDFRKKRVGTSLMTRVHLECIKMGYHRMALVSSDMGLSLYRRLGYRPLAYFTALRPKEDHAEAMTIPFGYKP